MGCDKVSLRAHMREIRDAAHSPERSALVRGRVLALAGYEGAQTVFVYHSVGSEVDTLALIEKMRSDGKTVCLPAIRGRGLMDARRMDVVLPGPFGIPRPEGPVILPEDIDLVLVPGLAFDRACYRLGQGGGYYDRYLPGCRGLTVGLAYECQMVAALPLEAHDARLDLVVTEKTVYTRP